MKIQFSVRICIKIVPSLYNFQSCTARPTCFQLLYILFIFIYMSIITCLVLYEYYNIFSKIIIPNEISNYTTYISNVTINILPLTSYHYTMNMLPLPLKRNVSIYGGFQY